MCSRDFIAEVAARAASDLRIEIEQQVASADEAFRSATVEDTDGRLGQYFRVDNKDGWWWHRRPSFGPLADYLAEG